MEKPLKGCLSAVGHDYIRTVKLCTRDWILVEENNFAPVGLIAFVNSIWFAFPLSLRFSSSTARNFLAKGWGSLGVEEGSETMNSFRWCFFAWTLGSSFSSSATILVFVFVFLYLPSPFSPSPPTTTSIESLPKCRSRLGLSDDFLKDFLSEAIRFVDKYQFDLSEIDLIYRTSCVWRG